MTLYVGTSGWQYKDWRGVLYPDGCPVRLWLEEYAARFATVESNAAFYRLPARETFEAWRERTPPGFVVAVKASRFLTHVKRLREPEEPVERLLGRAAGLGDRLGPVLLQLPPTLRADPGLLDACLACFPPGVRVAVEPRHESWWTPATREVLVARGAALCWADVLSRPVTPLWPTTGWGYVRFHQGRALPWPHYGRRALTTWAHRIAAAWPADADVYAYFNNDPGAAAVGDAALFAAAARAAGLEAPLKGRGELRDQPRRTRR
ncbi:histidine kinase [Streptomyces fumigatiscleroticus]|nr:histidine kinase [Streptomyces fumigatiscleroticus]